MINNVFIFKIKVTGNENKILSKLPILIFKHLTRYNGED